MSDVLVKQPQALNELLTDGSSKGLVCQHQSNYGN